MSNTEFISQMAAFTSLQVQQEALYYNNANYAQSLAGREVIVARSTGLGLDVQQGIVTRVNFSGGEFQLTVNGQDFPLRNVMEVVDHNSFHGKADGSDGAFATSLIGKYVTVGWFDRAGLPVIQSGIVERLEIKDGQISIIIDDLAYPLRAVAKVESPESAPVEEPDDNDDCDTWFTDEPPVIPNEPPPVIPNEPPVIPDDD
jgi:hypothetical protein